ncbi:MAG: metalloregulator ArsR/SmtB family transcription factor [Alphaproteobacteria bacterium]|nr:metalloregulator ArsR/SmtB family transcription factor [Alphaproteobacteria bacterium]
MDIDAIKRNAKLAVAVLKALANEKRLMIVCALYDEERCVGDLEKLVGLSQSAMSQHLARLRRDGLVSTRREAQTIYYSLNEKATRPVLQCLHKILSSDSLN